MKMEKQHELVNYKIMSLIIVKLKYKYQADVTLNKGFMHVKTRTDWLNDVCSWIHWFVLLQQKQKWYHKDQSWFELKKEKINTKNKHTCTYTCGNGWIWHVIIMIICFVINETFPIKASPILVTGLKSYNACSLTFALQWFWRIINSPQIDHKSLQTHDITKHTQVKYRQWHS